MFKSTTIAGFVRVFAVLIGLLSAAFASAAFAQGKPVKITDEITVFEFSIDGKNFRIERENDPTARIEDGFAKTSRACPPFCIHAMSAAPGVETVGELEVMDYIRNKVETGKGLLVDARIPVWYQKGTIPGSVNIPFFVLDPNKNPYQDQILKALGATKSSSGRWNFTAAKDLLLYCNGPWCDQSPRAIENLIDAGYPTGKLFYYRGGMQNWLMLGLSVDRPGSNPVARAN
ncbi:MAG: rhodanese-like domain-containing protein [Neomegalonema sp.]|nr:rhodanese-like domain-containing protein [Neomegalonema sp.]